MFRRDEDFLLQDVAGAVVLVPVGKVTVDFPGMITLNATGAWLWQLLEQPQSEESLCKAICERYEVTEEVAQKDVQAFIHKLLPTKAILEDGTFHEAI